MARNRVILETITCDLCGVQLDSAITKRIGSDRDTWELDLCERDATVINEQISAWTANARKAGLADNRRPARQAKDDWEYLESLGFKRHRGRKTPEENAALSRR